MNQEWETYLSLNTLRPSAVTGEEISGAQSSNRDIMNTIEDYEEWLNFDKIELPPTSLL